MIYDRQTILDEYKRVAQGMHPETSPEVIAEHVSEQTGVPAHLVHEAIKGEACAS